MAESYKQPCHYFTGFLGILSFGILVLIAVLGVMWSQTKEAEAAAGKAHAVATEAKAETSAMRAEIAIELRYIRQGLDELRGRKNASGNGT